MSTRTTPLGFLPGDIDVRSHCIFVYQDKDDVFLGGIARYLNAGLHAGEMCVCALPGSSDGLYRRLQELGADPDSATSSGQLSLLEPASVYLHDGTFDWTGTMRFWGEKMAIAESSWNGIRVYGDLEILMHSRIMRLKLLEYESIVNRAFSFNIALCGYQSSVTSRTLLTQAKSVHPIIATPRSIQANHRYLDTNRFLSSFYKFRRVSRVYPASGQYAQAARRDLEEVAARTPLTMTEIEEMKIALSEAFANALEHGCRTLSSDKAHIHVRLSPHPTEFVIEVRDHGSGFTLPDEHLPGPDEVRSRGFHLMRGFMDYVGLERRRGDTIIVMRREYSCPFDN